MVWDPVAVVPVRSVDYEVDMLWRQERPIAELDGRAYHDHEQPFERDRVKDADLLAAGYRVVRITWQRLSSQPDREAARLHKLLGSITP